MSNEFIFPNDPLDLWSENVDDTVALRVSTPDDELDGDVLKDACEGTSLALLVINRELV